MSCSGDAAGDEHTTAAAVGAAAVTVAAPGPASTGTGGAAGPAAAGGPAGGGAPPAGCMVSSGWPSSIASGCRMLVLLLLLVVVVPAGSLASGERRRPEEEAPFGGELSSAEWHPIRGNTRHRRERARVGRRTVETYLHLPSVRPVVWLFSSTVRPPAQRPFGDCTSAPVGAAAAGCRPPRQSPSHLAASCRRPSTPASPPPPPPRWSFGCRMWSRALRRRWRRAPS